MPKTAVFGDFSAAAKKIDFVLSKKLRILRILEVLEAIGGKPPDICCLSRGF
ncbi:MAG: hypothetical protein LBE27_08130 [Deltaproteobacteria bacterium]|nr:hypothetical protein [Deltaproteobacteria bacterium]